VRIHLGCVLISIREACHRLRACNEGVMKEGHRSWLRGAVLGPGGCLCKVGKTLNFGERARVTWCIGRRLENGFPSAAKWALRSDVNQYPIESRKLQGESRAVNSRYVVKESIAEKGMQVEVERGGTVLRFLQRVPQRTCGPLQSHRRPHFGQVINHPEGSLL
jgi:hypothetical protein